MAKMVDIARKRCLRRRAVATGAIRLKPATIGAVRTHRVEKGDPLPAAEMSALQAMQSAWQVHPHTHPAPITSASVAFDVHTDRIWATTTVEETYKTGLK